MSHLNAPTATMNLIRQGKTKPFNQSGTMNLLKKSIDQDVPKTQPQEKTFLKTFFENPAQAGAYTALIQMKLANKMYGEFAQPSKPINKLIDEYNQKFNQNMEKLPEPFKNN